MPQAPGRIYLFPQSPVEDDVKFCNEALKHNLIIVPGTGFGFRGFFRLAYCVDEKTIVNSQKAFEALAAEYR